MPILKLMTIEASCSVSIEFQTAKFSMSKTIELEAGDDENQIVQDTAAELRATCQQWAEFTADDLAKRNGNNPRNGGRR